MGDDQILLLAGDIGGTNTRLQLWGWDGAKFHLFARNNFESQRYTGLIPVIGDFLDRQFCNTNVQVKAACFGVAGPIQGKTAKLTNLPWRLDEDEIMQECGISLVKLINDFEAIGYGIDALDPADLIPLQAGEQIPREPRVVIGAGTGLGVCLMAWCEGGYRVLPSEGGHADFSPLDELQYGLQKFLAKRHGHVSYERVVSGPGLVEICEYLCATGGEDGAKTWAELQCSEDVAAEISRIGMDGANPFTSLALDIFSRTYGAYAGNLALISLAKGGVYIAGGIAPKLIDKLRDGSFMGSFYSKGRYESYLSSLPVSVIANPDVGLLGARQVAFDLLSKSLPV